MTSEALVKIGKFLSDSRTYIDYDDEAAIFRRKLVDMEDYERDILMWSYAISFVGVKVASLADLRTALAVNDGDIHPKEVFQARIKIGAVVDLWSEGGMLYDKAIRDACHEVNSFIKKYPRHEVSIYILRQASARVPEYPGVFRIAFNIGID